MSSSCPLVGTYLWSISTLPISAQLLLLLFAHMADWIPCSWVKAIFCSSISATRRSFTIFIPFFFYVIDTTDIYTLLLPPFYIRPLSTPTLINIIEIDYSTIHPSSSSDQHHIPPQPCRWRTLYGLICHECSTCQNIADAARSYHRPISTCLHATWIVASM